MKVSCRHKVWWIKLKMGMSRAFKINRWTWFSFLQSNKIPVAHFPRSYLPPLVFRCNQWWYEGLGIRYSMQRIRVSWVFKGLAYLKRSLSSPLQDLLCLVLSVISMGNWGSSWVHWSAGFLCFIWLLSSQKAVDELEICFCFLSLVGDVITAARVFNPRSFIVLATFTVLATCTISRFIRGLSAGLAEMFGSSSRIFSAF